MIHPQDDDEDLARGMGTPDDGEDAEDVSDGMIDTHSYAERAEKDHGYETVSEDRSCAVRIDPCRRHEVEEEVYGRCA